MRCLMYWNLVGGDKMEADGLDLRKGQLRVF